MRTYFKKGDKLTVIIIIKKCNAVFIKVETKTAGCADLLFLIVQKYGRIVRTGNLTI